MQRFLVPTSVLFGSIWLFAAVTARAEMKTVAGHVPAVVSQLQPVARAEKTQRLRLAIGLASRDEAGLDAFLKDLYDPASANYHHYLSPEQFTARFGPTEDDYNAVIAYAQASGLDIAQERSNRVVVNVEGPVANIENAFQIHLYTYQHPTESRAFYAPDVEPSVPAQLPVAHISGLNNYTLPHPRHWRRETVAGEVVSKAGTAPGGQLWGNDFRRAYVPGTTLTGAGQSLGLVEFEGFYQSDITAYENAIGMGASQRPQLQIVSLDGGSTPQEEGDNGEECSLDIEVAIAMAPGLSKVYVFEDGGAGNNNGYFDDVLESMVEHPEILQFSCSWGGSTDPDPTAETLFKQMAAQGQSFFNASGDSGAFVGAVEFPSDSPSITQVGGTTLTVGAAPKDAWDGEVVWAWDSGPGVSAQRAASSGGGISTYYSIPDWQAGVGMNANGGSATMRNSPDVAANADNVYLFTDDGSKGGGWGGTSCAAPLWAAYAALVNEQAASQGLASLGFANPSFYSLAAGSSYNDVFHDIKSGNNTWRESPTRFDAAAGYDLCTGLGSMNGVQLMNALHGLNGGSGGGGASNGGPVGSVKVTILPAWLADSGAQWQVDGGALQNSGAVVSNLSVGAHTVSFAPLAGWSAPANVTVNVKTKKITRLAESYAFLGQGTYNGLFSASPPGLQNCGMIANLVVNKTGAYSGRLALNGQSWSLTGKFDASAQATNFFDSSTSSGGPLALAMTLNTAASPPIITGTVTRPEEGWTAALTNEAVSAASTAATARYTALISPGTPPGDGYMLLVNHNGTVGLAGALADGVPVSQAAKVSTADRVPVYARPSANELITGWLSLQNNAPAGTLQWIRAASASPLYPAAFTNSVSVQGSLWMAPLAHASPINLSNGQLTFSGGMLASNLSFNVSFNINEVTKLSASPTNSLTGSINPATGLLRLIFGDGSGRQTKTAIGVVLQSTATGGGYFLTKTNSGAFALQP